MTDAARPDALRVGQALPSDPARYRDPVAGALKRRGVTWWHALVFGILVYGVGEKLLLPAVQGYLTLGGELRDWRPDIEALVSGFVLAPAILSAYVWQIDGVHNVFKEFARQESFTDDVAFRTFMAKAAAWAKRPWWSVSVVIAAGGVLVQHLWLWDPANPKPVAPWWTDGEPLSRVVALILAAPALYAAAQIVLHQVRLGWTLRRLWQDLGDYYKAATRGLRSLARNVSILATVGAVVLLNLILGGLLPQIREEDATPDFLLWIVIFWAAYLIVVPGITLMLIWPAHEVMARTRDTLIGDVAAEIDKRFESATRSLDASAEVDGEVGGLDNLRKLRDWLDADLPKWPLPQPVRAISWSTVVPISLTVLTMVLERVA